jgi:hypothetical protein
MKKIALFLCLFLPILVNAFEVDMIWQKTINGNKTEMINYDYYEESLNPVFATKDGGLIMFFESSSTNLVETQTLESNAIFIVKYDRNGNKSWTKIYDTNQNDFLLNVTQTKNDEYIVVNLSNNGAVGGPIEPKNPEDYVLELIKFDKNGNFIWKAKNYTNQMMTAMGIPKTYELSDGSIILNYAHCSTETYYSEMYLMKYSKDGEFIWKKTFSGETDVFSIGLVIAENDEMLVSLPPLVEFEELPEKDGTDARFIKFNPSGEVIWKTIWGGDGEDSLGIEKLTSDGGFIATGETTSTNIEGITINNSNDKVIVKYSKTGDIEWQRVYNRNKNIVFKDFYETSKNEYIFGGYEYDKWHEMQPFVMKCDSEGNLLWEQSYYEIAMSEYRKVLLTNNDEILMLGMTTEGVTDSMHRNLVIVKYDSEGNFDWKQILKTSRNDEIGTKINPVNNNYMIYGTSTLNVAPENTTSGNYDGYLIEYDKNGEITKENYFGGKKTDKLVNIIFNNLGDYYVIGQYESTDILGLDNAGGNDIVVQMYSYEYNFNVQETTYGKVSVIQKSNKGIISPTAQSGYELSGITVKDTLGKEVETTPEKNGTYTFDLYDDVTVEAQFGLAVNNPKTGIIDFITVIFIGFVISLSGFFLVKKYNERLEI